MPPEKTEQEKFLDEVGAEQNVDIFDQPLIPEKEEGGSKKEDATDEVKEADAETLRNRRERRLTAKLEAERASAIQLAEQLRIANSRNQSREETSKDYLKDAERIYGTDTPEGIQATELLKNILRGLEKSSRESSLEDLRAEQRKEREEARKAEMEVENMLEEIEEDHNVDLTANTAVRTGFLKLLEKMSPKDADGNIIQYADHQAVWDVYQSRTTKKTDTRAKDTSSRSMVQSGASANANEQQDAVAKFLSDNGII